MFGVVLDNCPSLQLAMMKHYNFIHYFCPNYDDTGIKIENPQGYGNRIEP